MTEVKKMTLGSLFSGSGGFELAGVLCGIEPKWNAEIEPYPCRVTAARFPGIPNHGDVMKINGANVEPVDIITFGSPCQDLSVAGKQAGIHEGERSNLFFEAIRIIKEMRDATANEFPRFAVWENVPGAFSSNDGKDFKAVLEAFCGIQNRGGVTVPVPQGGMWQPAGCILGDGYSVAWRVYDAQYWGVPQRRKRIYLIADFTSERAGEILFKPDGLQRDSETGGTAGEGAASDAEGSAGRGNPIVGFAWANSGKAWLSCAKNAPTVKAARNGEPGICYAIEGNGIRPSHMGKGYSDDGKMFTLNTIEQHATCYALEGNTVDRASAKNGKGWCEDVAPTLNTQDRHAVVYNESGQGYWMEGFGCLRAEGENRPSRPNHVVAFMGGQGANARSIAWKDDGKSPTLRATESGSNQVPDVCYAVDCRNLAINEEKSGTLQAKDQGGYSLNYINPIICLNDQGGV